MQGLLLLFCSQAAWKLSRGGTAGVTFRGEFTAICFPTLPSFISSSPRGRLPRRWWVRAPDPAPCKRAIVQTSVCEMEALCCFQVKGFSTKAGELYYILSDVDASIPFAFQRDGPAIEIKWAIQLKSIETQTMQSPSSGEAFTFTWKQSMRNRFIQRTVLKCYTLGSQTNLNSAYRVVQNAGSLLIHVVESESATSHRKLNWSDRKRTFLD